MLEPYTTKDIPKQFPIRLRGLNLALGYAVLVGNQVSFHTNLSTNELGCTVKIPARPFIKPSGIGHD